MFVAAVTADCLLLTAKLVIVKSSIVEANLKLATSTSVEPATIISSRAMLASVVTVREPPPDVVTYVVSEVLTVPLDVKPFPLSS